MGIHKTYLLKVQLTTAKKIRLVINFIKKGTKLKNSKNNFIHSRLLSNDYINKKKLKKLNFKNEIEVVLIESYKQYNIVEEAISIDYADDNINAPNTCNCRGCYII
jgi:hypothetical protein